MFWEYFKNIKFLLVDQPGILQGLLRGSAGLLDAVQQDILYLRDQFMDSSTDLLDEMARSRGLFPFPGESKTAYRYRLINAYQWWVSTQSERGLAEILMNYSGLAHLQLTNLDEPDRWAEFIISAEIVDGFDSDQWQSLISAIDELKPARSKLAGIDLKTTTSVAEMNIAAASVSGIESILVSGDNYYYYVPLKLTFSMGVVQTLVSLLARFETRQVEILDCGLFDTTLAIVDSGTFQTQAPHIVDCGVFI